MRLDDGQKLIFQDSRKFGRLWLVPDPAPVLAHLGPEPFAADFTPAYLAARLHGRSAPIKALLLDQGLVAGVGNIYADEALFRAGIHPLRPAGSLDAVRSRRTARRCAGGAHAGDRQSGQQSGREQPAKLQPSWRRTGRLSGRVQGLPAHGPTLPGSAARRSRASWWRSAGRIFARIVSRALAPP
jgi:hypothetical protein